MSMIKVENLSFSYSSDDVIFDNVSFTVDSDWKLGFVGRNGRGKTTFLNLLLGKYEYSGRIVSSVEFDYFPYRAQDMSALTSDVLESVCPSAREWEIMREFYGLGIDCGVLFRPFGELSAGERTKVLLAALFLDDGKFLLLDEPTTHLDCEARKAVARYLAGKKGFILVSHDRAVLDGCVDHILSINRSNIEVQSGNFSSYLAEFERRQDSERRADSRLRGEIKRLQESAGRTSEWAARVEKTKVGTRNSGLRPDRGYIGHKSAKMAKRAKTVEARRSRAIEQKQALLQNAEYACELKLSPLVYRAERLVSLSGASPAYGGRAVCAPVSFDVMRGDRIALDGVNGSGKSSLLKMICGQDTERVGAITVASGLTVSYVPQDTSQLCGTLADLARSRGLDEGLFKTVLHKMGFEPEQLSKQISAFSEGQKKKTLIAASLCERAHLYVWDEPLNYIDVYSRMQIERLLLEFAPTMIFAEHDRAFRDAVSTRTVTLEKISNI